MGASQLVDDALFSQQIQLLLIDLYFARLVHRLAQIGDKNLEDVLLFLLRECFANLIFLGGEVLFGGRLAVNHGEHGASGPVIDGLADLARLKAECQRSRTAHGADIGNLAVGCDEVTGLVFRASLLRGLLQIVERFRTVGKFFRLLGEQLPGALVLEFALYAVANLSKSRGSRRLHRGDLINRVAGMQRSQIDLRVRLLREGRTHKLLVGPNAGQRVVTGYKVGADDLQPLGRGGFFQRAAASG